MQNEDRKSLVGHFPCAWKCKGKVHIHPCFGSVGPCLVLSPCCDTSPGKSSLLLRQAVKLETAGGFMSGPCGLGWLCLLNCTLLCSSESCPSLLRWQLALQSRDEWRWGNEKLCCWDPNGPNCACCLPLLILETGCSTLPALHGHHLTPDMSHVSPTLLTFIFAPCSHNYTFFIFPTLHKLQPEVYPSLCALYLLQLPTTHLSLCTLGALTLHLKFSCFTALSREPGSCPLAGTVPAAGENQLASEGWAASFHFHMRLKQEQQQL